MAALRAVGRSGMTKSPGVIHSTTRELTVTDLYSFFFFFLFLFPLIFSDGEVQCSRQEADVCAAAVGGSRQRGVRGERGEDTHKRGKQAGQ